MQMFNTYAVTYLLRSRSFISVKTISVIYYTVSSQSVGTEETSVFTRIFSKCKFQSFGRCIDFESLRFFCVINT